MLAQAASVRATMDAATPLRLALLALVSGASCTSILGDDFEVVASPPAPAEGGTTTTSTAGGGTGGEAGGGAGGGGLAPLGAACDSPFECGSGLCVDDVCCADACAGVCRQCGESGQCDVTPSDDPDCPSLACPPDEPCRDYDDAITADRCAELGRCKDQSDCPYLDLAARTPCGTITLPPGTDVAQLCDGEGSCLPPDVECGAVPSCPIGTSYCCARLDADETNCVVAGTQCGTSPQWSSNDTGMVIRCDEPSDCPTGQQCCYQNGNGNVSIGCFDDCPNGNVSTYVSRYVMCATPKGDFPCASGTCIGAPTDAIPDGWLYCDD